MLWKLKEVTVFNRHFPKLKYLGGKTICIILMVVMVSLCGENEGWISVFSSGISMAGNGSLRPGQRA